MVRKSCIGEPITACSKEPISLEVSASPLCNGEIVASVVLPEDYGKPETILTSCSQHPCTEKEFQQSVYTTYEETAFQFTKSLHLVKYSHFELLVYGDRCLAEICLLPFNSTTVSDCSPTTPNNSLIAEKRKSFPESGVNISAVVPALLLTLLLAIIVLGVIVRRKFTNRIATDAASSAERASMQVTSESSEEPKSVFIVFSDDHPLHREVVLKFAAFLQSDFGFQIILDLYDRETIYTDPAAWLERSLKADNILVIWSPGSDLRLKNRTGKYDMFSPVVRKIKNDALFERDTSKYIFVYLDYCSEKHIQSILKSDQIKTFKIEKEMKTLLRHLEHTESTRSISETAATETRDTSSCSDYGRAFKEAMSKMRELAKSNPNWYYKESTPKTGQDVEASHSRDIPSTSQTMSVSTFQHNTYETVL